MRLVVAAVLFLLGSSQLSAQQIPLVSGDSSRPMLGSRHLENAFPIRFPRPTFEPSFFLGHAFRDWVGEWDAATRQRLRAVSDSLFLASRFGTRLTSVVAAPPVRQPDDVVVPVTAAAGVAIDIDTANAGGGILSGALAQYADIGMRVGGRGELGGAWTRYTPCDPALHFTCSPSLFPQIKPDMQFKIQVNGTISDRIHVDVDYDQAREFDAANNINVYYRGLEDEILQRVEVGDVSIQLPASRYLTQGIPTGNFGLKAMGQLGPIEFQTVFAQQRGDVTTREFRLGGAGNSQDLVQDAELVADDADYVQGQFFFVVPPDSITGAPYIDALALRATDAPASVRPESNVKIQVYRDEKISATNAQQQAQLGYFLADAVNGYSHRGLFRRLVPEDQYTVHPSGLWIMLRSPLRPDEALAISYVSTSGDTIGTVDAEASAPGVQPTLKLLRGTVAYHQPGAATWDYEMHQVYRLVSSGSVDVNTIDLRISLGDVSGGRTFREVNGKQVPLIRFFGLDEDAPVDVVDGAQIWQPGQFGGGTIGTSPIGGTFVVFPSLHPFKNPGAIPSERLSEIDTRTVLGSDANTTIYDNADPVVRENGGRFRLNFKYRLKVEGVISTFSLGAFGIREGSERLMFGTRTLQPNVDYSIDYEIGMVTLNNPQGLFAANPGEQLRATWEQKSLFQVGATSVLGMNAKYQLGRAGELNFVGLYQAEKSQFARPQLGVEPASIFMGGVSGRLDLGGSFLDRALALVPGLRVGGTSAVSLNGEVAFSLPNPNRKDVAFVDDFESTDERMIPMSRRGWTLGSRPQSSEYAAGFFPATLDVSTATSLVWQHDVLDNGRVGGGIFPRDIDRQIVMVGSPRPEPVLWLTFGDSTGNDGTRRWRSMTSVLSTSGVDMSRSEYLEFYLWSGGRPGQTLVFDIGVVSEDAFYYDQDGQTTGTYGPESGAQGRTWGLGVLDAEAELGVDIWGPDKDALGLWNQPCAGNPLEQYGLGDPNANCARRNNRPDTEDLDGDGVLRENDEPYFRYVIPIDETSPYLVRDKSETGTDFQLFRIPLRTEGKSVNASDATWRFVRHLRMTVVSSPEARENFVFARMRVVGARWTKRDVHGVNLGLTGDEPGMSAATAQVQVSPVSRLTDGAVYSPPAGVSQELQDPSSQFGGDAIEYNEKAMRIAYNRLAAGDRVETFFRFAQQSRSFLTYRQLRLWAIARKGNFGPVGDQRLLVKIGNDSRNYYVYQTKLEPAIADRNVVPNDWLPEVVIDFEPWFKLRQQAEEQLAAITPAPGQALVLWSPDSTYGLVVEDRARAPNLGAVREIAFGIYNGGIGQTDGEIWIDDMRLGGAVRDPGMAGNIALDVRGGDFLAANLTYADRGSAFRQLNQEATYQRAGDLNFSGTAQLGNMLPGGWGVDLPLTVAHTRTTQDPVFLQATDVRAAELDGLRETGADATRVSLLLRKRTPSTNPLMSVLVDGLAVRASYTSADNNSMTMRSEASGFDGGLTYNRNIAPVSFDFLPGFVEYGLRLLTPGLIEDSEAFNRLTGARFRFTPERISFGSSYFAHERRAFQFLNALATPNDSVVRPIESPRRGLDNDAQIAFRPFETLSATFSIRSSRDLLAAERATNRAAEQSAIDAARSRLGGLDIGWETTRSMSSEISFRPQVTSWLRPGWTYSSRFGTDRNPSYLERIDGDSTSAVMQRRFQADRQMQKSLQVDPAGLISATLGTAKAAGDTTSMSGWSSLITRLGNAWRTVDLIWNSTLGSQFEREVTTPGFGYQFGIGDLDGFRLIGGDTAVYVNARDQFTARSGFQLPAASTITLGYERTLIDAFDQRGGHRTQLDRKWPSVQATVNNLPLPPLLNVVVRRATVSAGYEHTRQLSVLDEVSGSDRGGEETRISPAFTFTLPAGMSLTYRGMLSNGESRDPTGFTEQNGADHAVTLGGTFHPPESMQERFRAPFNVNLTFRDQAQHQCRERIASTTPGFDGCVPYIDFGNRSLNVDISTIMTDVTVGLNLGYNSRQNYIGTKNGTSQFQLGLWGEFNFCAGTIGDCRNTIR